jgi:hypothetical protein
MLVVILVWFLAMVWQATVWLVCVRAVSTRVVLRVGMLVGVCAPILGEEMVVAAAVEIENNGCLL